MFYQKKRPIRILHILHSLHPGGMEKGVINLINHVNQSQFIISICCLKETGALEQKISLNRRHVIILNPQCHNPWQRIFKLKMLLKNLKIDIVHTHNYGTFFYGALACGTSRRPFLIHGQHGDLPLQVGNPYFITMRKLLALRTNQFHTVSLHLKELMQKTIGISSCRITYIPNGVDLDIFKPQKKELIKKEYGFFPNDFIIMAIGSFYPWKNISLLIQVAFILKKRNIVAKIVILGDGPLRQELIKITQKNKLEDYVQFLGRRDDVPSLLNLCDVFVQPSLTEGMSNTILEAMACAKPVIASQVGGNSELVIPDVTGYLFPSNNAIALTETILFCYNNPERRNSLGMMARKIVEDKYCLNRMVSDYEKLYTCVMQK